MARPSEYTQEQAIEICSRIAEGQSLVAICRDDALPDVRTVYRWLAARQEFCQMYARAREDQADTLADEIIEIADDGSNDWMERNDKDNPGWVANGEHIQRSRLRVDSRKWIASKLKPKKYGEKIEQTHQGANGGPIVISSTDAEL